jgi:acetyl-CoA carboxylase alpha subunit
LALTEQIFANLNAAQVTQLARHPKRPYTLDYIRTFLPILTNYMATAFLKMMLPLWVV